MMDSSATSASTSEGGAEMESYHQIGRDRRAVLHTGKKIAASL